MNGVRNPRGISKVIVVLVVAVVLGLGLVGWRIFSDKNKERDDPHASQQIKQSSHDSTQNDPTEDGKYLVINEWGIKVPLSDVLKGKVKYGVYEFTGSSQALYFASKSIAAKHPGGPCDITFQEDSSGKGMFGGSVALGRLTSKPNDVPMELLFQKGSYWYSVDFSNGGECYGGDTGIETGEFKREMSEALRRLEPLK